MTTQPSRDDPDAVVHEPSIRHPRRRKDATTPVRNPRHRNQWDIEGKLFPEDKWSLCGRFESLAAAEEDFGRFVERAGKRDGDCMFYSYVRLMAPRQAAPIMEHPSTMRTED